MSLAEVLPRYLFVPKMPVRRLEELVVLVNRQKNLCLRRLEQFFHYVVVSSARELLTRTNAPT